MSLLCMPAEKPVGERQNHWAFCKCSPCKASFPQDLCIQKSVMQKWFKSVVYIGCITMVFGKAWGTSSKTQFNWKMPFQWTHNLLLQISTAEQISSALNNELDKDISFTENWKAWEGLWKITNFLMLFYSAFLFFCE